MSDGQNEDFTSEEELYMTKMLAGMVGLLSEGNSFNEVKAKFVNIPNEMVDMFLESLYKVSQDDYDPTSDLLKPFVENHDFKLSDFHQDYQKLIRYHLSERAHDILETTGKSLNDYIGDAKKYEVN